MRCSDATTRWPSDGPRFRRCARRAGASCSLGRSTRTRRPWCATHVFGKYATCAAARPHVVCAPPMPNAMANYLWLGGPFGAKDARHHFRLAVSHKHAKSAAAGCATNVWLYTNTRAARWCHARTTPVVSSATRSSRRAAQFTAAHNVVTMFAWSVSHTTSSVRTTVAPAHKQHVTSAVSCQPLNAFVFACDAMPQYA